jgi:hypothetical protein
MLACLYPVSLCGLLYTQVSDEGMTRYLMSVNNNNLIDLLISSTCFGQSFTHLQESKIVVYSNVVYCPVKMDIQ